jgi:hypothetical protein
VEVHDLLASTASPIVRSNTLSTTLGWSPPARTLVLGPGSAGNMLELIVLHFDDGRDMVIQAMPMRRHYESLLPRQEPPT